jgi:c-di-AMP phosphodiesterase-like protein
MNNKLKVDEIKTIFGNKPFSSDDLYNFYLKHEHDLKKTTFRWRVRILKDNKVISTLKRGVYVTKNKKDFEPLVGNRLSNLFLKTKKQFPYSAMCIWETAWLNNFMVHQAFSNNIILEVDKDATPAVFAFLQESHRDVYLNPGKHEVETYIIANQNNIIVKNLTLTSPLKQRETITIPTIEKIIVDLFTDNQLFATYQGAELQNIFQELFRTFNINQSILRQYANKRHVRDKLISFLKTEVEISKDELLI